MGRKSKTPNIKRQERRQASKMRRAERRYDELRNIEKSAAAEYKKKRLAQEKARYEKSHQHLTMIREKLSHGEMNEAIRYLYDRGVIKGKFQYYEEFLEQHYNELDMNEIQEMLNETEAQDELLHQDIVDLINNPGLVMKPNRGSHWSGIMEF